MQLVSGVELEKQLWTDWMFYITKYFKSIDLQLSQVESLTIA